MSTLPARLVLAALVAGLQTSPLAAQTPAPRALTAGATIADSLVTGSTQSFSLQVGDDRFVRGSVDQVSVDVIVTVTGPDGVRVGRFDGPERGAEPFSFDIAKAGEYRLEVAPAEGESGRYRLVLETIEPIATNAEARIGQLVSRFGEGTPGGEVGIVRDGNLATAVAYGTADLTHGIRYTLDTPTNIGSTTKQFTAFAILLLAQRGKLSLDDDVRTHLPELKDFGTPITLRNLLTHTSGYREFLNLLAIGGARLDYDYVDREQLVDIVNRQPELQNTPGEEWNYNNTAFGLAARVVERVSGETFPAWMRENVFLPLGMHHTFVRASPRTIVPGRAIGYTQDDDGSYLEASDLAGAMGAGGIYTTVGDLAKWMRNLGHPTLGGPEVIQQMTTRFVLIDGDTTDYGLGLFIDEVRGVRRIHHGGADVAHRSTFEYYPDLDAGFISISNFASVPGSIAAGIQRILVPDNAGFADAVTSEYDPASFDPEEFDAFEGTFALDGPAVTITFRRDGTAYRGQVSGQPEFEIVPTSDTTFHISVVDASITFHAAPDGTVRTLTLHQNGDHPATRVGAAATPAAPTLGDYVGRYFSDEVETYYDIAIEDDALVARHRRIDDIALTHTKADTFSGTAPLSELRFERSAAGEITGFFAGFVRTRNVWFARVAR